MDVRPTGCVYNKAINVVEGVKLRPMLKESGLKFPTLTFSAVFNDNITHQSKVSLQFLNCQHVVQRGSVVNMSLALCGLKYEKKKSWREWSSSALIRKKQNVQNQYTTGKRTCRRHASMRFPFCGLKFDRKFNILRREERYTGSQANTDGHLQKEDRQTDRQAGGQTDGQTDRQAGQK